MLFPEKDSIEKNEEEFFKELNDEQKKAVRYIEGPQIISAGAGSGKTKVLTYKIAYLINFKNINPLYILALTFTNKASKEIKERVKFLIGNFKVKGLSMGTFHSIFLRILKSHIHLLGIESYNQYFTILDENDAKKRIKDILKKGEFVEENERKKKRIDINYINQKNKIDLFEEEKIFNKSFEYICKKINYVKNEGITYNDYLKKDYLIDEDEKNNCPFFQEVYKIYEINCQKNNEMDFNSILLNTFLLFKKNNKLLIEYQNKYDYILIDEYQDTNKIQFEIIKLLSIKKKICIIGDENQSIYKFRGARIENLKDFKNYFSNVKIFKLTRNYRSTEYIVKCANSLIKNNTNVINLDLYSLQKSNEKVKLIENNHNYIEVDKIASIIKNMVEEENYNYKDFAILYRANSQSYDFENKFLEKNIPFKTYKRIGFFDSLIIKIIINYLQLIINTNNNSSFNYIVNKPKRNIGIETINKIIEYSKLYNISCFDVLIHLMNKTESNYNFQFNKRVIKHLELFYNLIMKYKNQMDIISASKLITDLINEIKLKEKMNEEKYTKKLEVFIDKLYEMEREFLLKNKSNFLLQDFMEEISIFILNEDIEDNEKKEEENKVKLMTIHNSKGLEFNNIFIVGAEEGYYPSGREDDVEEERRVFYVAITRAKKNCFISYCLRRKINEEFIKRKISRFLYEIDNNSFVNLELKNYIYISKKNESNQNYNHNSIDKNKLYVKKENEGKNIIKDNQKNIELNEDYISHYDKFNMNNNETKILKINKINNESLIESNNRNMFEMIGKKILHD